MKIHDEVYGDFEFSDKIESIINLKPVQRLKKIYQNGADRFVNPSKNSTRYDHSVGVMILIKILGGREEEQIAGLLHDISHTVFSHTVDIVFENQNQDYHQMMKKIYLQDAGLSESLKKHSLNPETILDEDNFIILEQKSPDLCADRLDYLFRDMYKTGRLTKKEIKLIISSLIFDDGKIKCKDVGVAALLFNKFLELNKEIFFNPINEVANLVIGNLIRKMLKENLILEKDLLKEDDQILDLIKQTRLSEYLIGLKPGLDFDISLEKTKFFVKRKLRYIDPIVCGENKRLTELDINVKKSLQNYLKMPQQIYYTIPSLDGL